MASEPNSGSRLTPLAVTAVPKVQQPSKRDEPDHDDGGLGLDRRRSGGAAFSRTGRPERDCGPARFPMRTEAFHRSIGFSNFLSILVLSDRYFS